MSVEVNQGKPEQFAEAKRKVRLAGPARPNDQDPHGAAKSFDLAFRGHYENTTGGDSKMNSGLRVELYAPAA